MSAHNYILFKAGGHTLAADASSVHCIHDGLAIQPEDDTQEWFLGLAVADERLLPVTDLGIYLEGTACQGRVIEVARSLGIVGLKIDEVHGVSRVPPEHVDGLAEHVKGDVSVLDACVTDRVINEIVSDEVALQFRVIDFSSLVQSSRFLSVSNEREMREPV